MATFNFLRWQPPPYPPFLTAYTMKIVAEYYTEKFDTLKFALKNNIRKGSTETYTDSIPLLIRNAKKYVNLPNCLLYLIPFKILNHS